MNTLERFTLTHFFEERYASRDAFWGVCEALMIVVMVLAGIAHSL